ncbi:MAG: hypothetical protein D6750_00565 [Bacteroidetes bacterium]|nr:MAG: hypothetical protein D6750_00565 [Bacteroidota bacterium]
MRSFLSGWLLIWSSGLWAQRASFLYALWDLDFEAAEREITFEWNGSYITWDQHRLAFFRAVFPLGPAERKAFWEATQLYERQFERQIAPALPELVADMYAQRAIVHALESEWALAGYAAWQSWRYLQRGLANDPLTAQWQGLWQVIFATLPPPYSRWLPGKPSLRWEAAQTAFQKATAPQSYTAWESSLVYFFVLRNFDTLAGAWIDTCRVRLFQGAPPPYLWRFALGLYAFEEGQLSQAESLFQELTCKPQIARFPYPYYWLGKLYLYRGERQKARQMWQAFVQRQTQPFGLAAQYGWRGYLAWMEGDTAEAQRYWQTAVSYSGLLWEEDLLAQALARQWLHQPPDSVEKRLWAARWLLHQGAYPEAQDTLEPLRVAALRLSGDQRTALYYTYGRLYHRWGKDDLARFAYYQATRQVAQANRWMQAYAALYLAQLYERARDWHPARLYYTEAQKIGAAVGRTGVVQKAKAGYERLKNKRYPVPGEVSR